MATNENLGGKLRQKPWVSIRDPVDGDYLSRQENGRGANSSIIL